MACVRVFVDVLEVRIERVVIEVEVGVCVARALPGIGYVVNDLGVNDMRFAEFLIREPLDRGWTSPSHSRSCQRRRSACPWEQF